MPHSCLLLDHKGKTLKSLTLKRFKLFAKPPASSLPIYPVVLQFESNQLMKAQSTEPYSGSFCSVGTGWGLKSGISNRFPGYTDITEGDPIRPAGPLICSSEPTQTRSPSATLGLPITEFASCLAFPMLLSQLTLTTTHEVTTVNIHILRRKKLSHREVIYLA